MSDPSFETRIGVVVVLYQSDDVIGECLDSLLASTHRNLRIVLVDNDSPDSTVSRVHDWALTHDRSLVERSTRAPASAADADAGLLLLRSPVNLGYAGGVNAGLRALLDDATVQLFWVLNPDCVVAPDAASQYLRRATEAGSFGLMSGRTFYFDPADVIQSDGGRVNRWTGVCRNIHQGLTVATAADAASELPDYFVGANVVASRGFLDQVGLMPETYFLFYEEVEWALQRGDWPLVQCPQAVVHHRTGTAIGSKTATRAANGFANYFNYRNRLLFVRKNNPLGIPLAFAYSALKLVKLCLERDWEGAWGALCGSLLLPPPAAVRARLTPEAARRAFGR